MIISTEGILFQMWKVDFTIQLSLIICCLRRKRPGIMRMCIPSSPQFEAQIFYIDGFFNAFKKKICGLVQHPEIFVLTLR